MPAVKQQSPDDGRMSAPTTSQSGSAANTGYTEPGIKLNVYGRGKTGKTRLVNSFPKPLMLIGTEDGTKSIANGRKQKYQVGINWVYELLVNGKATGTDFIRINSTTEYDQLVGSPNLQKHYKTWGLDNGSGFQDLITKETLNLDQVPVAKAWGMTDRGTWAVINGEFAKKVSSLLDLSDKFGANVAIIAHEKNFGEESGGEVITPKVASALTPGSATWLDGAVDYICQTLIRSGQVEQEVKVGNEVQKIMVASGKYVYSLRIGPHSVYRTGFRSLLEELPDFIDNPSYTKIVDMINGKR